MIRASNRKRKVTAMENVDKTIVDKTSETVDKASDYAHKAVDKVTDVTHQAVDKLGEKGEQLKNIEERLIDQYVDYTRKNPLRSVAIAVGVGFLLSRLFNDR